MDIIEPNYYNIIRWGERPVPTRKGNRYKRTGRMEDSKSIEVATAHRKQL